jgi:hypothetical protein
MFSITSSRVAANTPEYLNLRIRRNAEERIVRITKDGPKTLERRFEELDREWDVERVLTTLFSGVILAGLALGASKSRRWYALPAVAAGFLLQHSLQGWCPPLTPLRQLGFRTPREIENERHALKKIR